MQDIRPLIGLPCGTRDRQGPCHIPDCPEGRHWYSEWPHEGPPRPRSNDAPAVHDDNSYLRAYGPGAAAGLGFIPETRKDHREAMRRMGLAEGAPDTPGRAPSAVEIARKRGLWDQAVRKVKRGPLC